MKTVSATEFKARCLALLEDVRRTRRPLVVTRHGKAVATIAPYSADESVRPNPLKDSVVLETDIVSPIDVPWDGAS